MNRKSTLRKLVSALLGLALVAGGAVVAPQAALAVPSTDADWHTLVGNNWKTTICHRTHSVTNPYRKITVSDSSVYGTSGHSNPNHDRDYTVGGVTYHVFNSSVNYPANSKFWGDIIPPQNPARYSNNPNSVETSGMNWTAEGIALYDGTVAGCRTMTDREFIASELEGGETFQNIAQDLNDQDPDGPRWTANQVQTTAASITAAAANLTLVNDSKTTPVNAAVTDSAATNDTKPAGTTFAIQSNPANGTVTMDAQGNYTYTPNNNYSGADSFNYKACLPAPDTATCKIATVNINIANAGTPVASNDEFVTPYMTAVSGDVDRNDSVPAGSTFALDSSDPLDSTEGTLNFNTATGSFTYTPAANFTGTATYKYKVCLPSPSTTCSAPATVSILVIRSQNDSNTTPQNTAVTGSMTANDTPNLIYNTTPVTGPTNGTVTLTAGGGYTYTPNNGYSGSDSFTYRACDLNQPTVCTESVVTITIPPAVITPPVVTPPTNNNPEPTVRARNDNAKTKANKSVQANVAVNDNPGLGTKKVTDPKNGTVALSNDGTFVYTPAPDFVGKDTYTYTACDTNNLCATATVDITVAPDATDDSAKANRNVPIKSSAASNDTKALNYTKTSEPANGTVVLNPDGTYTYTPKKGFVGTDKFNYVACDPKDATNCAEASVTVAVAEPELVAPNLAAVTPVNNKVAAVLGDPSTGLVYALEDKPKNGTVVVNPDGTYTYTPAANFVGRDTFTYKAVDPEDTTRFRIATVILTVQPQVKLSANNNTYLMKLGQRTQLVTPLVGDTGVGIKVTSFAKKSAFGGTVRLGPAGKIIYTPKPGFTGRDTFRYTITDQYGQKASATQIIFVPASK